MKHTYLLITAFLAAPPPTERTWSPQKNVRRWQYFFLCLKHRGHWTESHLIYTRCTERIAEIKTAIFQSVSECHGDEWTSSSNCGRIAAKIARFNSINSENIGGKITKFVHNVARILPFNVLKADLRSANQLSNAKARSKGHFWWCLRPSSEVQDILVFVKIEKWKSRMISL